MKVRGAAADYRQRRCDYDYGVKTTRSKTDKEEPSGKSYTGVAAKAPVEVKVKMTE